MEVKIKGKRLTVSKLLKKDETYKITRNKGMFQLAVYKQPKLVTGISSMCEDGLHILMLDYDNVAKWVMHQDLKQLINLGRSPFIILKTNEEKKGNVLIGNYQAICLDKLTPYEIIEIQRRTHCDGSYITMPLRNIFRSWVLRTSEKGKRPRPQFVEVIGDWNNLDNEISHAHYEWLLKQYNIPPIKYTNSDGCTCLYKNVYETLNRVG